MTDKELIEQSRQLDADIVAMPRDKVFTKRTVVIGFFVVMSAIGYLILSVREIASSTNRAVREQLEDKDETIADQESIIEQATDAIILLLDTLEQNGITPPRIVIEPED